MPNLPADVGVPTQDVQYSPLSDVVSDPDLAESFTILRSSGGFYAGGWRENPPKNIPGYGVVTQSDPDDLKQLPEADRVTGSQTFYSMQQLYGTHSDGEPGTSDVIEYHGHQYRIAKAWDYSARGYWKAIGLRIS